MKRMWNGQSGGWCYWSFADPVDNTGWLIIYEHERHIWIEHWNQIFLDWQETMGRGIDDSWDRLLGRWCWQDGCLAFPSWEALCQATSHDPERIITEALLA